MMLYKHTSTARGGLRLLGRLALLYQWIFSFPIDNALEALGRDVLVFTQVIVTSLRCAVVTAKGNFVYRFETSIIFTSCGCGTAPFT